MNIHPYTLTLDMSSRTLAVAQWRKHGKVFQPSMRRHLQQQASKRGVVMTQQQHMKVRRVR